MNRTEREKMRKYEGEEKSQNCCLTKTHLPAKSCIFCEKPLEEVGGKRLIAQKLRGVSLSNQYKGDGDPNYPCNSFKLFEDSDDYFVVWGENGLWTQSTIEKATSEFIACQ